MPINPDLLSILRCPVTKQALSLLKPADIERFNNQIDKGEIHYADDSKVENPLAEALITNNGRTIYRIDNGIPVMLEDRSIPTEQFDTV